MEVYSGKTIEDIKDAFDYLQHDLRLFHGKPRSSDLCYAHNIIIDSFRGSVQLIESFDEWNYVIDVLVKVSQETTTTLQKSLNGPLSSYKLFSFLAECANDINRNNINSVLTEQSVDRKKYHLHSDISRCNFKLTRLFSSANQEVKRLLILIKRLGK